MSKTLGQVAYDAYMTSVVGESKPNRNITPAWQAAAEAVVNHYDGPAHSRKSKRSAVIEAARAVLDVAVVGPNKMVCPTAFFKPLQTLHGSLKALDSEEE